MWQGVINIFQCICDIGLTFYGSWFSFWVFFGFFWLRFIKAYKKFGLPLER